MNNNEISISLTREQWHRIIEAWYYAEGEGAPVCDFEDISILQDVTNYTGGYWRCEDCNKVIHSDREESPECPYCCGWITE